MPNENDPNYAHRSPDGAYWYDGEAWQLVDGNSPPAPDASAQAAAPGASAQPAAPDASAQPGDAQDPHQALLAKVGDPSELQGHFENAMEASKGEATAS